MSEQPLVSPEEMASVLSSNDKRATGKGATTSDVFSFRRPVMFPADEEVCARRVLERLADALSAVAGRELEMTIKLEVRGFQQQQTASTIDSLPAPTWAISMGLAGGGGLILLLEPVSALTLVELALGGHGNSSAAGRRPTQLESRVMTNLARSLREPLAKSTGIAFDRCFFSVGSVPTEIAAPGETVGAGLLEIHFGDEQRGGMLLATAGLLRGSDSQGEQPAPRTGVGPIAACLGRTTVEARPVLRAGRVCLNDLVQLGPGSVLRLEAREDHPLELRVGGQTVFRGRIVRAEAGAEFKVSWRRGTEQARHDVALEKRQEGASS